MKLFQIYFAHKLSTMHSIGVGLLYFVRSGSSTQDKNILFHLHLVFIEVSALIFCSIPTVLRRHTEAEDKSTAKSRVAFPQTKPVKAAQAQMMSNSFMFLRYVSICDVATRDLTEQH